MCNYCFYQTVLFKKEIIFSFILLFIGCQNQNKTDYEKDLMNLKTEMQKKLDTGEKMMLTDRQFMFDTDSILEIVYTKLLQKSNPEIKKQLIIEQKDWERQKAHIRDSLWKRVDVIFEETGITPQLEREIAYGTIAELNYDRAINLNKRLIQTQ